MALIAALAVLSRGPESDVRIVDGRVVGDTSGYVAGVRLGNRTLRVSATPMSLRWLTVHVDRNTRIFVGDREGVLENLGRGAPVRVGYQMDGDRRVATVIALAVDGGGRRPDATATAVGGPSLPRDPAVNPVPAVQPSDPLGIATPAESPRAEAAVPAAEPPPPAEEPAPPRAEPAAPSESGPRERHTVTPPQQAASPERPTSTRPKRVDEPRAPPRMLPPRDSVLELTASVDEWIQAAKRRNIAAQITLYDETVREFYGRRGVTRDDVRAAKLRMFGSGEAITDVGSPLIQLQPSGQAAVVRFTKWFVVDPDGRAEHGDGVQELRWERTSSGWRIVGETDTPRTARARDAKTAPEGRRP